jgi:hypothetical protein
MQKQKIGIFFPEKHPILRRPAKYTGINTLRFSAAPDRGEKGYASETQAT